MAAAGQLGRNVIADGVEPWKALLFEMVVTAMLCFVVHGATNIKRKGHLYINTFPIGMAYTVGYLMAVSSSLLFTLSAV